MPWEVRDNNPWLTPSIRKLFLSHPAMALQGNSKESLRCFQFFYDIFLPLLTGKYYIIFKPYAQNLLEKSQFYNFAN